MTYVLIQPSQFVSPVLYAGAIAVEVCNEDGTVHDARFSCPTCYLKGSLDA